MKLIYLFLALSLVTSCKEEEYNTPPPPPPVEDEFIRGADLSFLTEIESYGQVFYESAGTAKDMLDIFSGAGCNAIRLRVWHSP